MHERMNEPISPFHSTESCPLPRFRFLNGQLANYNKKRYTAAIAKRTGGFTTASRSKITHKHTKEQRMAGEGARKSSIPIIDFLLGRGAARGIKTNSIKIIYNSIVAFTIYSIILSPARPRLILAQSNDPPPFSIIKEKSHHHREGGLSSTPPHTSHSPFVRPPPSSSSR